MYGCESWTIKKAERWKNWCFQILVLEKTPKSSLDSKEIKPVNPKGNQPWISGRTNTEAEAPTLWPPDAKSCLIWKKPWCWGRLGAVERVMEDEMVRWHHQLNGHEFEQTPGDSEGQRCLECCSSWGHKQSDTTKWTKSNNDNSKDETTMIKDINGAHWWNQKICLFFENWH